MADDVELTIVSHPRWLRLIRQVVQEYASQAGFDENDAHAVTLAVGEAVGNVIKHSYRGRPDQRFTMVCRQGRDGLEVIIRDHGEPFDPEKQPALAPDELRVGGRGIYLMRTLMDEIEYGRENEANVICLRKRLKTPAKS